MVETEYFADGTVPEEYCDHHVSATICEASGLLANEFCPAETKHTSVYMVDGSGDSGDGAYLLPGALAQGNYCTVHTAVSIIPPVPEIQEPLEGIEPENPSDDKTNEPKKKEPKKQEDTEEPEDEPTDDDSDEP